MLKSEIRIPQSPVRWHAHLHDLATAIHETSGLMVTEPLITMGPLLFGYIKKGKIFVSSFPVFYSDLTPTAYV
jgi:hypothetical protein